MAKEDFNNDAKMAGVIGAGHTVTALYETRACGVIQIRPGSGSAEISEAAAGFFGRRQR